MAPALRPPLIFIGFMGAGKSTAARAAALALDAEAVDSDEVLEARLGMPIVRAFDQGGEAAFRADEEAVVLELLTRAREGTGAPLVSLGGGAVGSEPVRAALRDLRVVWLDLEEPAAWERAQGDDRPLARDRSRFAVLHAQRDPLYDSVADAIVAASLAREFARVLPAVEELDRAPAGTRLLYGHAAGGDTPVYVREGLVGSGFWPLPGRRFLITDGNAGRLYGDALEPLSGRVGIMPGEQSKTIAHAEIVWTELARAGMTRSDHVAALGGGVVGDLAGFCAATYQRGVAVVQVPTTLVAQVDSAYGGKTGVDLPEAKNYVGAYHQPAAVLLDPATLRTLPAAERAAGYAEVLKTALIAGGELWERVRAGAVDDEATILRCARTKLAVVAVDERDAGPRQVLNLGHTVAHAIETATGYATYRHGEAVGLGLLAALRLSGREELRSEVAALLTVQGLPTRLRGADPEAVVAATARDKKRTGEGSTPFVLVHAPGDVRPSAEVAADELRNAVRELVA